MARTDIRTQPDGDPLGCLGDLGWYNIRFSLMIMGRLPDAVRCRFNDEHNTVPMDVDTTLYWYDNKKQGDDVIDQVSSFHCSFNEPMRQWAEITSHAKLAGTADKCLMLDDFVLPRDAFRVHFTETTNVDFADYSALVRRQAFCVV